MVQDLCRRVCILDTCMQGEIRRKVVSYMLSTILFIVWYPTSVCFTIAHHSAWEAGQPIGVPQPQSWWGSRQCCDGVAVERASSPAGPPPADHCQEAQGWCDEPCWRILLVCALLWGSWPDHWIQYLHNFIHSMQRVRNNNYYVIVNLY